MKATKRLESLDALRGFDLLFLVGISRILKSLSDAIDAPWFDRFMWWFEHVEWQGFSTWDLVMPLFMFMSGVSIPYALSRFKRENNKKDAYLKIFKRVVLLWIFGMMCQGNLLGFDPDEIYFYSNTLQSIAIGYAVAAILYMNTGAKTQAGISAALLLIYWAGMELISAGGYGGGNYTPDGNFAEWLDRTVLGRFRDCAYMENGTVVFPDHYRYTWIWSSLNFAVTVITGMLAGHILKNDRLEDRKKTIVIFMAGAAMTGLGWLWSLEMPVIKKIWTSSMTLVSSGYCFLLMGLFYYIIDYKRHNRHIGWLKVYGKNSIAAYMIASCISFSSISDSLFYGLEQYLGAFYPVLITTSNVTIIYLILLWMYKKEIFLKV